MSMITADSLLEWWAARKGTPFPKGINRVGRDAGRRER